MSEQERASRDACARYAPALAALDAPGLDANERSAALEHLANCAYCQADQRAYAQLDSELRGAFGPAAASPLRTAALLAAIGATHEPAPQPRRASQPVREAIRSVVDLGDIDTLGGSSRMSETDGRGTDSDVESGREARQLAAIPTLRPGPRGRGGQRRWAVGFSAVAAVVVFVVVAATLFASHAARPGVPQTAHNAATRTAMAQATASAQLGAGSLNIISMDSPTDGWAIGSAPSAPGSGQNQNPAALIYHYDGAQWTLKAQVTGFNALGGGDTPAWIKMFSATDGWAFDGAGDILHYDGTAWRQAPISLLGGVKVNGVIAFDMVSPTEGWAVANVTTAAGPTITFLHYLSPRWGSQWSMEQSAIAVPGLNMSSPSLSIYGFSATTNGDAWAVGAAYASVTNGQGTSNQAGLIFHRVNGVWRVASALNQPNASTELIPSSIVMTSPTSGWIAGASRLLTPSSNGTFDTDHALLMRYTGAHWIPVTLPIDFPSDGDFLNQIVANGPNDIWVEGNTNSGSVTAAGAQIYALLLHYDGKSWSQSKPDVSVSGGYQANVANIALAPDGSLWAAGSAMKMYDAQGYPVQNVLNPLVWLYRNGIWSPVPIASGK